MLRFAGSEREFGSHRALHNKCYFQAIFCARPNCAQKFGSMPNSWIAWMSTQMLWQSTLQRTSFNMPVLLLDRTASPNLPLIMENTVSTLERR